MHKGLFSRFSFSLLLPALILVGLSLIAFYTTDTALFRQQIFALAISLAVFLMIINIDYWIIGYYSKHIYFLMIVLLLMVFFFGVEARGSTRWIEVLGFRIQVSEIIKPFFVIFVANQLSNLKTKNLASFLKVLALTFPIFFLTLKQPDLGNAVIYLFTALFMMLMSGFHLRYFVMSGFVAIILFPLFFNLLHDYQKARITSFFDVTSDPFGSSYNSIQALISIGSGGFWGKGFGNSTQSILQFLPEHHTDFIFATMLENLGFIGGVIILALYFFLLLKIATLLAVTEDNFINLIVLGFYFLLMTHIFFNVGMNIGILPIVGITLPFLSYGGSSLITNFIVLGLLSNIAFSFKRRNLLEIR